ncbi:RNA 2',3'-cyclic phosphodiesterase [Guyparkeria sp. 1SP6A2]|nr:RNA 2',3'-cyclic phosphodiesterase [Guyparkeria sp. 1SP6A2]
MPEQRRVFIALWPDEHARAQLDRIARQLAGPGRPVPRAHLHLTLAFAGNVAVDRADCLAQKLGRLRLPTIAILLDRFGHFEGPGVTWIGPSRPIESLDRLAADARALCAGCGIEPDAQPFAPHVSLRRFAEPPSALGPASPVHWFATRVVLIESGRRGHPGPYRVLARTDAG